MIAVYQLFWFARILEHWLKVFRMYTNDEATEAINALAQMTPMNGWTYYDHDVPWSVQGGAYVWIFDKLGHPVLMLDPRDKPNALKLATRIVAAVNHRCSDASI